MRIPLACLAVAVTVAGPLQGFGAFQVERGFWPNDLRLFPLTDVTSAPRAVDGAAATGFAYEPMVAAPAAVGRLPITSSVDLAALDEMLRGPKGLRQQWTKAPELVVLAPVMEYHLGEPTEFVATAEQMTGAEMEELVSDLTVALRLLSGDTFEQFAAIHHESARAGANVRVVRQGQIVVGRYRGMQALVNTIGLGGRTARSDGTISGGAIVLDSEYDRTNTMRRLLRTHELGHALGYNHVQSRASIMNAHIGTEPTEFDRAAIMTAINTPPRHPQ